MRWILAALVATPMAAAAVMGPDLWFKLSFASGALLVVFVLLVPAHEVVAEAEEEMPPFMTTEQVLAFVERRERRLPAEAAPQIRSANQ